MGWGLADLAADAGGGAAPAPAPAPQAGAPSLPIVPPRSIGPTDATNLSPADYATFKAQEATQDASPPDASISATVAAQAPSTPKQDSGPGWTLQDLQQNDGALSAPTASTAPPPSPTPAPQAPTNPVPYDAAQSVVHGATLGADEFVAPAVMASMDWIAHKLTGDPESWGQSYDAERNQMVSARENYEAQNPVTAAVGTTAGGLLTPVGGLFTGAKAATMAGKAANFARNVGAGALLGGAGGFGLTDGTLDQRLQGAETGAEMGLGLGLAAPIIGGIYRGIGGIGNALSLPEIISQGARETAIGEQLQNLTKGAQIEQPVLPGVSYDMGQATNQPGAAAAARWAQGSEAGQPLASAQQTANNQAIRGALEQASGATGGLAPVPDSSAGLVNSIRDASNIVADHARRLWGTGPLATEQLPTAPFMQAVNDAVGNLDPGLQLGMSGPVQRVVDLVGQMPQQASARDMNSFKSALQTIARTPPESNPQAGAAAARIADAARGGIDTAINLSGSQTLKAQYTKARAFTARAKHVFGTQDSRALLAKNPNGLYRADASEGAGKLFNFANGSPEGAQNIQDIRAFLRSFRADWSRLTAGGVRGFDPARIDAAQQALLQHAREYVVGSLMKSAGLAKLDATGDQTVSLNSVLKFINANRKWMQDTGMFTHQQIDLFDRVAKTAAALKRTQDLRAAGNSTTFENFQGDRFVDKIISPWLGRVVRVGGAVVGVHSGGLSGLAEGLVGGHIVDKAIEHAKDALRETMAKAINDPTLAANLMAKASKTNARHLGPNARKLLAGYLAGKIAGPLSYELSPVSPPVEGKDNVEAHK